MNNAIMREIRGGFLEEVSSHLQPKNTLELGGQVGTGHWEEWEEQSRSQEKGVHGSEIRKSVSLLVTHCCILAQNKKRLLYQYLWVGNLVWFCLSSSLTLAGDN